MTLFYQLEHLQGSNESPKIEIDYRYHTVLWRPSLFSIIPKGVSFKPFLAWWFFHYLRLFYNRNYGLFLIYDGDKLIHRTLLTPGYFRFPFMKKNDLQIGDTFTDISYRGKGLATFAIREIIQSHLNDHLNGEKTCHFWYLVEEDNIASIRAIEKAGFRMVGKGKRKKRFGLSFLGYYELD